MYPVEVAYLQEPTADYVRKAAELAWNINLQVSDASVHRHPILINPHSKGQGTSSYF